jgi:cytidine deaminase
VKKKGKPSVGINENEKRLLETAANALNSAYVLWGLNVGAAVLGKNGCVYEGCNVESWISGLGICAERNAINHTVLHGNRKIREIAAVMDANSHNELRPCGACLQYIHDFAENGKTKIILARTVNGRVSYETATVMTIDDLLPFLYADDCWRSCVDRL